MRPRISPNHVKIAMRYYEKIIVDEKEEVLNPEKEMEEQEEEKEVDERI
jgi:hypothetical protein